MRFRSTVKGEGSGVGELDAHGRIVFSEARGPQHLYNGLVIVQATHSGDWLHGDWAKFAATKNK